MAKPETPHTTSFTGLNNVKDPLSLGLEGQVLADNVDINRDGKIVRAKGYKRATTNTAITGAYATKDLTRAYLVDSGTLYQVFSDLSTRTLQTGLAPDPSYFDEVNGIVYFSDGTNFGLIDGDGYRPWGIPSPGTPTPSINTGGALRAGVYQAVCTYVDENGLESSNSDVVVIQLNADGGRIYFTGIPQSANYTTNLYVTLADAGTFYLLRDNCGPEMLYDVTFLGRELPFWNTNTPRGIMPTYFGGRMYTAEYFPAGDASMVWRSLPLHFHHFDPGSEGISVPGRVLAMKSTRETHFTGNERLTQRGVADAIIIGTDREIYSYDEDQLVLLASYGVVPGVHAVEYKGKVFLWSLRGLCRALPFENLTESTVSVPPGLSAAAAVIEKDGTRRYVVALTKGGDAYNSFQ